VGGRKITSFEDCTAILVCHGKCALVGCGTEGSIHAILRNVMELGYSLRDVELVVLPLPLRCLCDGCRTLREFVPFIKVMVPKTFGYRIRMGEYLDERGTPCPPTIESDKYCSENICIELLAIDEKLCIVRITIDGKSYALCYAWLKGSESLQIQNLGNCTHLCIAEEPACIDLAHKSFTRGDQL